MAKSKTTRTSEIEYDGQVHHFFTMPTQIFSTALTSATATNYRRVGGGMALCDLDIVELLIRVEVAPTGASAKLKIGLGTVFGTTALFRALALATYAAGLYRIPVTNTRFTATTIDRGKSLAFQLVTTTAVGQIGAVLVCKPRNQ